MVAQQPLFKTGLSSVFKVMEGERALEGRGGFLGHESDAGGASRGQAAFLDSLETSNCPGDVERDRRFERSADSQPIRGFRRSGGVPKILLAFRIFYGKGRPMKQMNSR